MARWLVEKAVDNREYREADGLGDAPGGPSRGTWWRDCNGVQLSPHVSSLAVLTPQACQSKFIGL